MSAPDGSGAPGPSKAIPSLAKKQSDVTRMGGRKLSFKPTLPQRRKPEDEGKPQEPAASSSSTAPATPTRGRGRGRGRGFDGRGGGPGRPPVEMTASGPFAMGPANVGSSSRRSVPRSNFAPIFPGGGADSAPGASLTNRAPPTLGGSGGAKTEKDGVKMEDADDGEVYSDPDEGVEIVDMDNVRLMDWMAPESLRKEKERKKRKNPIKKEETEEGIPSATVARAPSKDEQASDGDGEVNLANAVDLSESEEEEEMERIIDDFALQAELAEGDPDIRQERLYFFQFPTPFPTFSAPSAPAPQPEPPSEAMDVDAEADPGATGKAKGKAVSFAEDTKPPAPATETSTPEAAAAAPPRVPLDGVIGQLEVYESGAVKMRLGDGIFMDVTSATQPSFLQQAVYLDREKKRLCVLGEVNKRFVVTPDIDMLLADVERTEKKVAADADGPDAEGLIRMES